MNARNLFVSKFVRSCSLAVLMCSAMVAAAQTPDTATLAGRVQDPSKSLIPSATITVTNRLTGLKRTAETNARGEFSLTGLPIAGAYEVHVSKSGFAETVVPSVTLGAGTEANVTVSLGVQAGAESVVVEGAATDVVLNEPEIGLHLNGQQVDDTPLPNRRITSLVNLNAANRPAISQGDIFMNQNLFTTNGGGRRQGTFVVDGANDNDSWGRQTIFTNIPEEAVQEVAILSNSFSSEYGWSTGTVMNIVTRSGGQSYHGNVLGEYKPGHLGAQYNGFTTGTATSGNQIVSDQLNQFAGALGGKLTKSGLTHFFGAGEWTQQRRDSFVNSALAPGVFTGHYRDLMGTLRLDQQVSAKNNAFIRASADGFYDTNPNGIVGGLSLPSVARTFYRRTYSFEVGDTGILTPTMVNNLRLQFQLGSPITQFVPVVLGTQFSVPISGGPTFTQGTSQSALLMNRQYGVNETLSKQLGKHEIKVGGDWLFAHTGGDSKEFGGPYFLGRFVYNTCTQAGDTLAQLEAYCQSSAFLNNIANVASYTQGYGNPVYTVNDNLWGVFAQDDYHVTHRLTLNVGLRYDQQTFADSRSNFEPRVGFVADPHGDGSTIVRGGFGIYYSQIVDNEQASYVLSGPQYINYTATPGQPGFPTSIAAAPLPTLAAGAVLPVRTLYIRPGQLSYLSQFFDTSTLVGYPMHLLNPYSEQFTFGVEQRITPKTVLAMDYVGTHVVHILRPLDVDAPASFTRTAPGQFFGGQTTAAAAANFANCTRPLWIKFYQQKGIACPTSTAALATTPLPAFGVITSDVNDGYAHYNALDVNLTHNFGTKGTARISYVWSHTTDTVDQDTTSQNPNDANLIGPQERGNAIFDQRNRLVASGSYLLPLKIQFGGVATFAGGLPFNYVTGVVNSGDSGGTTDRPVINGAVVGRNTGRGRANYQIDPYIAREFGLFKDLKLYLRAESFNVGNHPNYVGYNGTYGNGATAPATFGLPSYTGLNSQLPPRQVDFIARISF
jgi:hypothetical protein